MVDNKMPYDKDLQRGIVKIMILSYIKKHRTYPYQLLGIIKSLKPFHDKKMHSTITKNDIYNMTSALEKAGYIRSSRNRDDKQGQGGFRTWKPDE